ncbi:chondroitin AC/alginate lyase [Cantharellus anzutake]|uniref:chondroitin AC/alginate lyase n=1 Tax=Cantharellus anzutake TaxID=1750568 RepID=UPI0019056E06|nr:chondroitin AC/alginate lyase [Cantharellus anzutake]KAF8337998.1 chondroitin AC/alginate lyase [Cantharellus anzutake]
MVFQSTLLRFVLRLHCRRDPCPCGFDVQTNSALFGTPTFNPQAKLQWPKDPFTPTSPAPTTVRSDRPRLIAPAYKWVALPSLIPQDPYLKSWNDTIFHNASVALAADPLVYAIDGGLGGSGVLDVARQMKMRVKSLAYAYRMSNNTQYADRIFRELQNGAGNTTNSFGTAPDNWNTEHFLDLAEFTAAYAIAYDWLYEYWQPTQRQAIMWSILNLGLKWGIQGYTNSSVWFAWWRLPGNNDGNWNCVCNSGLTMGALAILGDDPTGMAAQMLGLTIPNAVQGCALAPSTDGTWSETANYWYFGTQAHAEMSSSLLTATGSHYGLLTANPAANNSGLYHLYVTGMTSLFNYGDCGPNKYSTTANAMMFYGGFFNIPAYTLMQRDRIDAPEPGAMFWYDPSINGAFWDNLPLDHYFDNGQDQWASMRTSWTDDKGLYVAIKAGNLTGHQAHGDLDAGDFVLDVMGDRVAGELGSANYLAQNYFSNETQISDRWLYYRKRTEGQNTIVVNYQNQNVLGQPTTHFGSSGTVQPGGTTVFTPPKDSTAFFTADLTQSYFGVSVKRGLRLLNGRKQVLLQDDITNANVTSQWRMHTNTTVTTSGTTATLVMPGTGTKVIATILNAPSGIQFSTAQPVRYPTDPPLPAGDANQDPSNDGVTVLIIDIPKGTNSIQVLFNPQWPGMSGSDFVTPPSVPIDQWTLTSHN